MNFFADPDFVSFLFGTVKDFFANIFGGHLMSRILGENGLDLAMSLRRPLHNDLNLFG